jgi:hypothetical protein
MVNTKWQVHIHLPSLGNSDLAVEIGQIEPALRLILMNGGKQTGRELAVTVIE